MNRGGRPLESDKSCAPEPETPDPIKESPDPKDDPDQEGYLSSPIDLLVVKKLDLKWSRPLKPEPERDDTVQNPE
jgi:hypothetical protein